jgi:hypothetical protein
MQTKMNENSSNPSLSASFNRNQLKYIELRFLFLKVEQKEEQYSSLFVIKNYPNDYLVSTAI